MDITNQQTMGNNSKFPWLSQKQIEKLEEMTANYTWLQKQQIQQQVYQQTLQQMKQQQTKDERFQTENELYQKSLEEKDPKQQNYLQSNVRLEQLADMVKEKYNLKADADTNGVIGCLMQEAQDKGVSIESLNNYLESWDEKFLYDVGLKEQGFWSKVWQVWTDIVGGALATASALPELAASWLATWIWWVAKLFWADEDKVDYYVNDFKQHLEDDSNSKLIWADPESIAFNIPKWIWDIAQVAVWEGLVKGAIQWTAKGANLLSKLKDAPTRWKMIAHWIEGAWDATLYSIIADWELPSFEEGALGGAIGAAIPWLWALWKIWKKYLSKWAQKLELSWIINPQQLNNVKTQLIEEGTDLATAWMKRGGTAEDVWQWMLDRGFQGDKNTIVKQLSEHAKKAWDLRNEVLSTSQSLHSVDSAKKSLDYVYKKIDDIPWLEDTTKRLQELMAKDQYTLKELDEIKHILDDHTDLFTIAGDTKAWLEKTWLANVRRELKKYIEDVAEKEGLWNIKLLNNEVQIAKGLEKWIVRKESAEQAREILSVFNPSVVGSSVIWGIWGGMVGNTWEERLKNAIIWGVIGKFAWSTRVKTWLAKQMNKLSGGTKKELERLVGGEVKTISKKAEEEVTDLIDMVKKEEKFWQTPEVSNKIDDVANATDNVATKTDEIVENADNVLNETENIVKQEEKVADQVENTVNKSEDVVQKAEQTAQKEESILMEEMKKHSREENERALKNIQNSLKREEEIINNFENYKKLGQITDETDPRWQWHLESYNKLKTKEKAFSDYLESGNGPSWLSFADKTDRELSFEKLKTEDDVYNYAQEYKNDILEEYSEKYWAYINPDEFRNYINNHKKIQASETHKWASYLAEEYFNKLLKEHPNGKGIVVAWWPGGGKWTSIDRLKIDQQGADILVDKTKGNKELKKMLENGMSVDYYVVVPDTEKIVSNIIGRAARAGELWRGLPINSVWIPTHKEVASVVTDLYKNGSPSWKFNLKFIDNTGEIEQINLKEGVEWFKLFKKYSKELNNITPERVQKEADQWLKDWKITQKQHDELIKGVWWIILVGSLLWTTIDGENEKEQV